MLRSMTLARRSQWQRRIPDFIVAVATVADDVDAAGVPNIIPPMVTTIEAAPFSAAGVGRSDSTTTIAVEWKE